MPSRSEGMIAKIVRSGVAIVQCCIIVRMCERSVPITGRPHNRRRMTVRTWMAACGAVVLTACSAESIDGAPPVPIGNTVASADEIILHLRIVNTESAPLAGMVPVASESPSLLSDTVSQGSPTGEDGESSVVCPKDKWLYVRAADPEGNWVAADYVEMEPGDALDSDEPVNLTMAAAASVLATLQHQDGSPITNNAVELLMIHPAHGQWWRAESNIDESGRVRFTGLPAGVFSLKLQLGDTAAATFREVVLTGGEVKDLGIVSPQPTE